MEDIELVIKIPKKEFGIEINDKFQNFFKRLKVEIKSRLISNDTLVCGSYELETVEMLLTAFKNATIEQEPKTGHWTYDYELIKQLKERGLLADTWRYKDFLVYRK